MTTLAGRNIKLVLIFVLVVGLSPWLVLMLPPVHGSIPITFTRLDANEQDAVSARFAAEGAFAELSEAWIDKLCLRPCFEDQWHTLTVTNSSEDTLDFILSSHVPLHGFFVSKDDYSKPWHYGGYGWQKERGNLAGFSPTPLSLAPGTHRFYVRTHSDIAALKPAFALQTQSDFYQQAHAYQLQALIMLGALSIVSLLNVFSSLALRHYAYFAPLLITFSYLCQEALLSSSNALFDASSARLIGKFWYAWMTLSTIGMNHIRQSWFPELLVRFKTLGRINRFMQGLAVILAVLASFAPLDFGLLLMLNLGLFYTFPIWSGLWMRMLNSHNFAISLVTFGIISIETSLIFIQIFLGPTLAFKISLIRIALALLLTVLYSIDFNLSISRIRAAHHTLRTGLKGIMADSHIERLLREGKSLNAAPIKQRATVMFVEVVGFSEASKNLSAEVAFTALRDCLGLIRSVVHKYDGIIDKSLGDGIVCFFSHNYLGIGGKDHEQRAVTAAAEIQQRNVQRINADPGALNVRSFPLRIGINTDDIYIGNIGNENRLDIALSGEGVIMAKRFEAACEPHKVLLGPACFESLAMGHKQARSCQKRFVPIKHYDQVKETYEFNPFADDVASLASARRAYWQHLNEAQQNTRFQPFSSLVFSTNFGSMTANDFSLGGLCLSSGVFLGNGVVFDLSMPVQLLAGDLGLSLLNPLRVEVIWGIHHQEDHYKVGVRILGINDNQRQYLLDRMRAAMGQPAQPLPTSA